MELYRNLQPLLGDWSTMSHLFIESKFQQFSDLASKDLGSKRFGQRTLVWVGLGHWHVVFPCFRSGIGKFRNFNLARASLVGGVNPFLKKILYSQIESFPQVVVKIKKCLKQPPSSQFCNLPRTPHQQVDSSWIQGKLRASSSCFCNFGPNL